MERVEWSTIEKGQREYEIGSNGVIREKVGLQSVEPRLRGDGRLDVKLWGWSHWVTVEDLMKRSFLRNKPPRSKLVHVNGDLGDCRLENLRYVEKGTPEAIEKRRLRKLSRSAKFGKKRSDLTKGE